MLLLHPAAICCPFSSFRARGSSSRPRNSHNLATHAHSGVSRAIRQLLALIAAVLFAFPARAVVVRGTVTTPLGIPLANARIQLIQGQRVIAFTIRLHGRHLRDPQLLSLAASFFSPRAPFTPSIGEPFYGGRHLRSSLATSSWNIPPSLRNSPPPPPASPRPLPQIPSAITLIPQRTLAPRKSESSTTSARSPGTYAVQTGQAGGPIALYVRGGAPTPTRSSSTASPPQTSAAYFDYSSISTTTLTGPELYRGANSALYGTGAEASVVNLATTRSNFLAPTINYTGDAGNFHTYRNEAILSGAIKQARLPGRLQPLQHLQRPPARRVPLHQPASPTSAYSILSNTLARFTLRNADSAVGLPEAHDIYGISASGKQADQDLYSGITVENVLAGNWHNLVRYGIARKREQSRAVRLQPANPSPQSDRRNPDDHYYGDIVTLRGANGYTATGQAAFITPSFDAVSNRDELLYQTNYTFPYRIAALFSFHYENERGRLLESATSDQPTGPTHQLPLHPPTPGRHQAPPLLLLRRRHRTEQPLRHRRNPAHRPRLRPCPSRQRWFRGTNLRANVATGVQEPIRRQISSPASTTASQQTGNRIRHRHLQRHAHHRRALPHLRPRHRPEHPSAKSSSSKPDYFHNQFNHQLEFIGAQRPRTATSASQLTSPPRFPAHAQLPRLHRTQGYGARSSNTSPVDHLFLAAATPTSPPSSCSPSAPTQ